MQPIKKVQQGFTLIELMIVVAIIGILAAIAIPAYSDYVTRSKVTEVVTVGSAAKTTLSEYYISTGSFPAVDDAAKAGLNTNAAQSNFIADSGITYSVTDASNVAVVYTFSGDGIGNSDLNNQSLSMNAAGSSNGVKWTCTVSAESIFKYVPANCRNTTPAEEDDDNNEEEPEEPAEPAEPEA